MVKLQRFFVKNRKEMVILATILLILAEICHFAGKGMLFYQILMIIVAVITGLPIILTAISSIKIKVISIDVLVSLAVIGAFLIKEFNEAAIVTWLFELGEVLEERSLNKTRSAVQELVKMTPQTALVIDEDGNEHEEDVDFLDKGSHVLVKAGMQIPVDGQIISGNGVLNEASITGEAKLVEKRSGDTVYAGTILEDGLLTLITQAVGEDTTFGKIVELVEEAQDSKTQTQRLIDKFAQYYTPLVLLIVLVVGLITRNLSLAITVLVLGCPGALVIGVPASTVAGIGALSTVFYSRVHK